MPASSQSKCMKVKNPCKVCLNTVTQKNGLKCQGVCGNWVHYQCIQFTPGKIKDIKSGHLKIVCPCPDCKTTTPKEYYVMPGYTCASNDCPAKLPPSCGNENCVENKKNYNNNSSRSRVTSFSQSCDLPSSYLDKPSLDRICGDNMRRDSRGGSDIEKVVANVEQLTLQINALVSKLKEAMDGQVSCIPKNQQTAKSNCACDGTSEDKKSGKKKKKGKEKDEEKAEENAEEASED